MCSKKTQVSANMKRVLVLLLCFLILIPGMVGSADSISDAEDIIARLENEKAELNSQLAKLKDDESNALAYQQTLQEKINNVQSQIDEARNRIEQLDKEILILEEKLRKSEQEMSSTIELFKKRLSELYKSGTTNPLGSLEILLNSSSLYEYTVLNEAMKSISEHDKQTMDLIADYIKSTEAERTECQAKKEEVSDLKIKYEKDQQELEGLYKENEAALAELARLKLDTEGRISENEDESSEMMARLENLIAQKAAAEEAARKAAEAAAANNSSSGGGGGGGSYGPSQVIPDSGNTSFAWPMPGVYYVTQYYGNNGHRGMDIAGPYGTPIVAAESGEVIDGNNYDSWGMSWGYYVLIYHNSTYTTRYAHLSSLAVSTGDYVSRGQVVGYEGSTGNSTGPHLHFEVYQNGSRVNPYPFIS